MTFAIRLLMLLVLWTGLAASAAAQGLPSPASDLPIKIGQTVWITSASGQVTKGKVRSLTPVAVGVDATGDRPTSVAFADMLRIEIPDSIRGGAVAGAVVGGLIGVFGGALLKSVHDFYKLGGGGTVLVGWTLGGLGLGAALGAALDAAVEGRRTVYQRAGREVALAFVPVVTPHGGGVAVRIRW